MSLSKPHILSTEYQFRRHRLGQKIKSLQKARVSNVVIIILICTKTINKYVARWPGEK